MKINIEKLEKNMGVNMVLIIVELQKKIIMFVTASTTGSYWPQSSQDRHGCSQVKVSNYVVSSRMHIFLYSFISVFHICMKNKRNKRTQFRFAFVIFIKQAVERTQRKKKLSWWTSSKTKQLLNKNNIIQNWLSVSYWLLENFKTLSCGRSSWFNVIVSTAVGVKCHKSWRMSWSAVVELAAVDSLVKTASWKYYFQINCVTTEEL